MNNNIAIFGNSGVEQKTIDFLKHHYSNVFLSYFSGTSTEEIKQPFIHYWYIQHKKNVDIVVMDILDIEQLIPDGHDVYYLYNQQCDRNIISLYEKYIQGFISKKQNQLFLDTYKNKKNLFY